MSLPAPCGLQLQGIYHCAVFVFLLRSTARRSGAIATIGAEVSGVFAAGCGSILNDSVLLALDAAAAGRRSMWFGAAKRRQGRCAAAAALRLASGGLGGTAPHFLRLLRRFVARHHRLELLPALRLL